MRRSNATHDLPPILQVDMDMSKEWRHNPGYEAPRQEDVIFEEVRPDGMSFVAPKADVDGGTAPGADVQGAGGDAGGTEL